MVERAKVLLVEDDGALQGLSARLHLSGCDVMTAIDVPGATVAARRERPDVLILDISLPGRSGLDMISKLRPAMPRTPVILITCHEPRDLAQALRDSGAVAVFKKPVDLSILLGTIRAAMSGRWVH